MLKHCTNCGAELSKEMTECPNCNQSINQISKPNETQSTNDQTINDHEVKKISKKKRVILSLSVILAIAIIAFAAMAGKQNKDYQDNINAVTSEMLAGAYIAEDTCSMIHDVWYNSIYKESSYLTDAYTKMDDYIFWNDFNLALDEYFISDEYKKSIQKLSSISSSIESRMKAMSNPPKKFKESYSVVRESYSSYNTLVNLATNPTGNLTTYTSNFNNADSDFLSNYKTLKLYVTEVPLTTSK